MTFRDEYKRLSDDKVVIDAISKNAFLIEEFLSKEIEQGNITKQQFTKEAKTVKIHGHCHQKALSNQKVTFDVLNLPENYKVSIISEYDKNGIKEGYVHVAHDLGSFESFANSGIRCGVELLVIGAVRVVLTFEVRCRLLHLITFLGCSSAGLTRGCSVSSTWSTFVLDIGTHPCIFDELGPAGHLRLKYIIHM